MDSTKSVREFIKAFNRRSLPLDLLVCNAGKEWDGEVQKRSKGCDACCLYLAGIMAPMQRSTSSEDQLELQFKASKKRL